MLHSCCSGDLYRRLDLFHVGAVGPGVLEQMAIQIVSDRDLGVTLHVLNAVGLPAKVFDEQGGRRGRSMWKP